MPKAVAGARTEERIAWLTPVFGFLAAIVFLLLGHYSWALGLALGTVLAWFNFCWLKHAVDAVVLASTAQEGSQVPRLPKVTYLAALLRYGLLALAVYVLYTYLHIPLGSMIVGMCALASAAIAASVWEILD